MTQDPWPFFPEIPVEGMDNQFMTQLINLRRYLDFPLVVTSSIRGDGRHSTHNLGRAVDINIWGSRCFRLIKAAPDYGFTGIGVCQLGPNHKRFIHLDTGGDETFPRPWVWSYTNG